MAGEALRGPSQGAGQQRLLWASTGTKNPAYSDVKYVGRVAGPETVDTIYPSTYEAFKAHGRVRVTLTEDLAGAQAVLAALRAEGVDLEQVAAALLDEGVEKFVVAQRELLASVEQSLLAKPQ